ncbi:alpha/beta fold hydrolase [Flavobacterium agrisoli]|uniref:Alpha/beta hydrolase n=1 Tax=Flavobacterium agrisoli TaxID=2793066 RepID=A0A934PMZ7_9FLAO|nr:alpha/beta hydrolase [Flavobacterium agrisoli]MBK0369845.1 alpha/beta hydrolase [Flavobacterium agrisoli]
MPKIAFPLFLLFLIVGCASSKNQKFDDYVFKNKKEKQVYIDSYDASLKTWGVDYVEEDIVTDFGKAHVIQAGPKNGKKLVLLHGMDASSTMWIPNIKALTKNHRIYAIDFLMEPGKSTLKSKALSKEEIVQWYSEIFKHYQLENFEVVAASRGGWMVTLLAITNSNSIKKMVLLSPAQTFEFIDKFGKTSNALFLKLFPSEKKFYKTLNTFSTHPEKINSVYKRQFYLANKYAKSNTSMLQMTPFSDEELAKITIPVLVLIGDEDVINSEKSIERAEELLPKGQTKIIKDAGHFLSIDQATTVNKAMLDFLD